MKETKQRTRISRNLEGIEGRVDEKLKQDAWHVQRAMAELVRVYQFRDRQSICFFDISVTQCYALSALVSDGPMSLGSLADRLFLDKSTASRVVDTLESKGYILRAIDPTDARALLLSASRKGKQLHQRIDEKLLKEVELLLEEFTPDVRQGMAKVMTEVGMALV